MPKGYKDPPTFDGVNFAQWRREVELWSGITKLDKKHQGVAVALSLTDTARSVATALGEEKLAADDGLKEVLNALDALFGKNNIDCQYQALKDLEKAERLEGQSILDYLAEFEIKYRLAVDLIGGEPYSDYMKAYKLIENAKLDHHSAKIVRGSISEWKFSVAVSAMKKIFGGENFISQASGESSLTGVKIKTEPVYYSGYPGYRSRGMRGGRAGRGRYRSGGRGFDARGGKSGCWQCSSLDHFKSECPTLNRGSNNSRGRNNYNSRRTYYIGSDQDQQVNYAKYTDICYAENHAILDSGAPRNVVGREWYKRYEASLDSDLLNRIEHFEDNDRIFVFGERSHSGTMKKIPLQILEEIYVISVYVVEIDIPLLIGLNGMSLLKMKVDYGKHEATVNGKKVDLIQESGHHYISVVPESVCFASTDVYFSAMKLHRSFGHASSNKIIQVLENNGVNECDKKLKDDLRELDKTCEFCSKHQRRSADPKVSINLSEKFNDLLCIDLKFFKDVTDSYL